MRSINIFLCIQNWKHNFVVVKLTKYLIFLVIKFVIINDIQTKFVLGSSWTGIVSLESRKLYPVSNRRTKPSRATWNHKPPAYYHRIIFTIVTRHAMVLACVVYQMGARYLYWSVRTSSWMVGLNISENFYYVKNMVSKLVN